MLATLAGAVAHEKFEIWDVAFYLGMAVMMGMVAVIPAGMLAVFAMDAFKDVDEDLVLFGCMFLCGAVITVLFVGALGPDQTDTFGRVAFSAIGVGGLGYAFYKADEVKSREATAAAETRTPTPPNPS